MKKEQKRNLYILIGVILLLLLFKSCQKDSTFNDTDGDGYTDKEEEKAGTSSTDSLDYPGATLEPVPGETIAYNSNEDCLTSCQDRGFDTGACGFSSGEISLGWCTVPGTVCSAEAGCFCSCKNIPSYLDEFTCGNSDDLTCGGSCPEEYPKCINRNFGEYDACVCTGESGISPDWDVGGVRHPR